MAEVDDEMLMAFADNELSAPEMESVRQAMIADPALALRIKAYQRNGKQLGQHFLPVMTGPIPACLLDSQSGNAPQTALQSPHGTKQPSHRPRAYVALAAALSGIVFVGALTTLWRHHRTLELGDQPQLMTFVDENGFAKAGLAAALQSAPSSTRYAMSGPDKESAVRPVYTFRTADGSHCRYYEIVSSNARTAVGVACRRLDSAWKVEQQIRLSTTEPSNTQIKTAGTASPSQLDATVDRLMVGDALSREQEQKLIEEGWTAGAHER